MAWCLSGGRLQLIAMKISVVIPAYNEEAYLADCLISLQKQNRKADEIIVVDNNSSDRTASIAKSLGATVVHETKQGIVYGRNTGFDLAKGDIIARGDADSRFPKNWLAHIEKDFNDRPDLVAVTGSAFFYDLPPAIKNLKKYLQKLHVLIYFKGSFAMLGHPVLFGSNMAIKKSFWNKVKDGVCLDEKVIHEDIDLAIHVNQSGGEIFVDPKLLVNISMRRAKSSLPELIKYLTRAPKTKLIHRRGA